MKMISLVSLLFLVTVSSSTVKSTAGQGQDWTLDMAENSVDDSFKGCMKKMYDFVMTYIEIEENTPECKKAWTDALNNHTKGKLGKYQSAAIYLYTRDKSINPGCSYETFNNACREGRQAYVSGSFKFYTLYYFLTDAIQTLKKQCSQRFRCVTVYRRTKGTYKDVAPKKEVRFGTFTSTSLKHDLIQFGNVSCFQIKTCSGAKLGEYSGNMKLEKEVLIPPYEVFRVTAVFKNDQKHKMKCKVVYELKSVDTRSNLQCNKTKKSIKNKSSSVGSF